MLSAVCLEFVKANKPGLCASVPEKVEAGKSKSLRLHPAAPSAVDFWWQNRFNGTFYFILFSKIKTRPGDH